MKSFKKTFAWFTACFIAVMACVVFMTACSSDEEPKTSVREDAQKPEFTGLITELNNYSANFAKTHPSSSRGDLGWGKFKESVKADHIGYSDGNWVGSVGESRKKWKELQKEEQKDKVENYSLSPQERTVVANQVDSLKSAYLSDKTNVGALHNAAILQSILNGDMDFETTEELVKSVISAIDSLGIEIAVPDPKDVVKEIDEFFENIYHDDIAVMYDRLSVKYPERKEEFQILSQFLSTTENIGTVENIEEFSNGYIDIINNSNISQAIKKRLNSNISIAPASHRLWRKVDAISK